MSDKKRRGPIAKRDPEAILHAAAANRPGSREALKQLLASDPALAERELASGLAGQAENAALEYASAGNALLQELLPRELGVLRTKLARPGDGALEELLIERVVLAWLSLTAAEHRRASLWPADNVAYERANFWDRRVTRLNADFLRASRTLATVRRLLVPSIRQLNIGAQQVNVAEAGQLADTNTESDRS